MATKFSLSVVASGDFKQPAISGARVLSTQRYSHFFRKLSSGNLGSTSGTVITYRNDLVFATGTVTLVSVANNDTVTINGVVWTAKTSGPTGNQWLVGVSNTADAAALVVAINASAAAGITGVVTATSALGVVTLAAAQAGLIGNAITLASSSNTTLAVSAARLAGGTETSFAQTF